VMAQLELGLNDVRVRIPWGGHSPRDLTRSAKMLYSKRERKKSMSEFVSVDQVELWPSTEKAPYQGAPSLLPLPF